MGPKSIATALIVDEMPCPLLDANISESEHEDMMEEPKIPLRSVPIRIFNQLPGFYWPVMEEDLEDGGLYISVPWSALEVDGFGVD